MNGYNQYQVTNKNDYKNFIVLAGEKDMQERKQLIQLFNQKKNSDGSIIKIILGSAVTKESVTFKSLKEIHIVNYQYNLSTIEQIIGRGVRHCSHEFIKKEDRNVKIFKYVTSLPNIVEEIKILHPSYKSKSQIKKALKKEILEDKNRDKEDRYFKNYKLDSNEKINKLIKKIMENPDNFYRESGEEKEYNYAEKQHILIRKIERGLKIGAIDCSLNIKSNIHKSEVEKYKDCEKDKKSKLCSAICDYQNVIINVYLNQKRIIIL